MITGALFLLPFPTGSQLLNLWQQAGDSVAKNGGAFPATTDSVFSVPPDMNKDLIKEIVEDFINAYNQFDVDRMVSYVHPEMNSAISRREKLPTP